jgi:hypothetical protein
MRLYTIRRNKQGWWEEEGQGGEDHFHGGVREGGL